MLLELIDWAEKAKIIFEDDKKWRLLLVNSFNRDRVESNKKKIMEALAGLGGADIQIFTELDTTKQPPHLEDISNNEDEKDAGDAGDACAEALSASDQQWSDISSEDSPDADPGIKKILKVFPGKIRKCK